MKKLINFSRFAYGLLPTLNMISGENNLDSLFRKNPNLNYSNQGTTTMASIIDSLITAKSDYQRIWIKKGYLPNLFDQWWSKYLKKKGAEFVINNSRNLEELFAPIA